MTSNNHPIGETENPEAMTSSADKVAAIHDMDIPEEMRTMLLKEVERFNYERKIMFDVSMDKLKDKIKRGFIPSVSELRRPLHWVDPDSRDGTEAMALIGKLLKKKGPQGEMRFNQLEFALKADTLNSMILFMESNIKRGFNNNECSPERVEELKEEHAQYLKWLTDINAQDTSHGETISMYKPKHPVVQFLGSLVQDIWNLFM